MRTDSRGENIWDSVVSIRWGQRFKRESGTEQDTEGQQHEANAREKRAAASAAAHTENKADERARQRAETKKRREEEAAQRKKRRNRRPADPNATLAARHAPLQAEEKAWVAHFISNPGIRYFLVALSFLMYFRASWTMCRWVWNWRLENLDDHHILGRPLLTFVLILVFGIYGAVYCSRLHGGVSYRDERIFFTTMDFTTKLFASMTLAGIRSSEFQEVLLSMLANTQTSFKRALKYEDTTPMLED
eukprot:s178_g10.t1